MHRLWRRFGPILPGLLVLAALVALRLADPAPMAALRLQGFDLLQRLAPRAYDPTVPVRVVAIDDESLRRLGQWPWPRDRLARLVDRLAQAGAAAVVLDLVLAEPDRTAPALIGELLAGRADPAVLAALTRDLPDPDRDLAEALGRTRSVVAFAPAEGPGRLPRIVASFAEIGPARQRLDRFAGAVPSLPEFEAAASGDGSIGAPTGRDEVLRRLPAVSRLGDTLIPSLAVEALRVAQGAGTVTLRAAPDGPGLDAIRIGEVILPVAPDGQFWLQFTPDTQARQVAAWRVLDPAAPEAELATALRGRIALIGVTATGFGDSRADAAARPHRRRHRPCRGAGADPARPPPDPAGLGHGVRDRAAAGARPRFGRFLAAAAGDRLGRAGGAGHGPDRRRRLPGLSAGRAAARPDPADAGPAADPWRGRGDGAMAGRARPPRHPRGLRAISRPRPGGPAGGASGAAAAGRRMAARCRSSSPTSPASPA